MKYSNLQYFLWLISGSEISALKNCPNEYNRHANIGMMILITSLFASFTAFIAGNTFVKNSLLGVICFAILWAVLIFAIDRSMVNSIKRDPKEGVQPFWSFFAPRLILAFILAFFMSIPLDHIVFAERIERQMMDNNKADWLKQQSDLNEGYRTKQSEVDIKTFEADKKKIEQELLSDCPLPDYKSKMEDYFSARASASQKESEYNKSQSLVNARIVLRRQEQDTIKPQWNSDDIALFQSRDFAKKEWLSKIAIRDGFKNEADNIDSGWRASKKKDFLKKDTLLVKTQTKLIADNDTIKKNVEKFKSDIEGMKGFDTQFTTLFLMPNWGVQILKWLIFLALLVIEILPTYLKLRTPIGQYDWEMYRHDQMMANNVEAKIISEKEISEQTENHRKTKEVELNTTIIDKVAGIELDLANDTLEEWEKQAKNSVKQKVSNANQQNHKQISPSIEGKLWKASNLQDEVFYLFKNGQPTNNELVYMVSSKTHKGTWEYLTPNKEIKLNIFNNIETYTIESITDDSAKLKTTSNYYLELSKV